MACLNFFSEAKFTVQPQHGMDAIFPLPYSMSMFLIGINANFLPAEIGCSVSKAVPLSTKKLEVGCSLQQGAINGDLCIPNNLIKMLQ